MRQIIATIGYEGVEIDQFISALQKENINLLIDVRDLPLSRKRGFSKNKLAEILSDYGISYIHLRGLGDPKPGREAARAGDYTRFQRIFRAHLRSDVAQTDLAQAADLALNYRACLMCYEADHVHCHRSIVADSLAQVTGLTIRPLTTENAPRRRMAA